MAFRIPGIDIDGNPNTNSFLGMSRNAARNIGHFFIIVGGYLSISFLWPDPTDLLIAYACKWMQDNWNITFDMAYVLWRTLIPWAMVLIGIYIFPYNTESLFNGYVNKAKFGLKRMLNDPVKLLFGLFLAYLAFTWFKGMVV